MRGGYPPPASVAAVPQGLELSAVLGRGPQVEDVVDVERADLREAASLLAEAPEALSQPVGHARSAAFGGLAPPRGPTRDRSGARRRHPVPGEPEPPVGDGGLVRRGARAPPLLHDRAGPSARPRAP